MKLMKDVMAIKILFQENMVEIEVEVMVVGQVGGMIYQNFIIVSL